MTDQLLHSILVDNNHSLLDIPLAWIEKINDADGIIFKSCVIASFRDIPITEDDIKNIILDSGLNTMIEGVVINRLEHICNNYYTVPNDILKQVEKSFNRAVLDDLRGLLRDKDITVEHSIKAVKTCADYLNFDRSTKEHNLNQVVNEYIDMVVSGAKDEFNKGSIDLNNFSLKKIFGKIRPVPYCIASRPGFRKTGLVINLLKDFTESNKRGLFFSLEDSKETLRNKYLAIKNDMPVASLNEMIFSQSQMDEIKAERKPESDNLVTVLDCSFTLESFEKEIRNQLTRKKIDYIIIDFLQLFSMPKGRRHESIGEFMKLFVNITKKYMIPLIFLSQVNDRDENKSGSITLDLGDLKDSATIEEYSRMVIFLQGNRSADIKEINIAKDTFGSVRMGELEFSPLSGKIL